MLGTRRHDVNSLQGIIQVRLADPILPITNCRLTFFYQRSNLRLGFRQLLAQIPQVLS